MFGIEKGRGGAWVPKSTGAQRGGALALHAAWFPEVDPAH